MYLLLTNLIWKTNILLTNLISSSYFREVLTIKSQETINQICFTLAARISPTRSASVSMSLLKGSSTMMTTTVSINQFNTKAIPSLGRNAHNIAMGTRSTNLINNFPFENNIKVSFFYSYISNCLNSIYFLLN